MHPPPTTTTRNALRRHERTLHHVAVLKEAGLCEQLMTSCAHTPSHIACPRVRAHARPARGRRSGACGISMLHTCAECSPWASFTVSAASRSADADYVLTPPRTVCTEPFHSVHARPATRQPRAVPANRTAAPSEWPLWRRAATRKRRVALGAGFVERTWCRHAFFLGGDGAYVAWYVAACVLCPPQITASATAAAR